MPFATERVASSPRALASPAAQPAREQSAGAPASSYWAAQKLIRTAELRIQVRDVTAALHAADSIAQSLQGLVADSKTTEGGDGKRTADVVLRIPSQSFPALLRALRGVGSIKSESIGAQDVTKEYADLETRVAVKEQTVSRLRGLLENRTAKLADVLEVERELGRAVAELEQMKGERRYYDQQIALSTVHMTLFELVPSHAWQLSKPVGDAFANSMEVLGNSIGTIIYLIVALLPWVAITAGIVWIVPPLRRRFTGKPSSPSPNLAE